MRVLIGSLIQESNTFSPLKSDLSFFQAGCLVYDAASVDLMADKRTELSGFIAVARRAGVTLLPTLAAWAASGGPLDRAAFAFLAEEFLRRVRAACPVDGVLLALHGALVAEGAQDADGWLLAEVRRIVGPAVPIVATLDLHANITSRMVAAASALVGFRTYPHVDMYETGERAARLLITLVRDRVAPSMHLCKVPMLIPPENAQTTDGPLAELMAATVALDAQPGCLSASLFTVQPWLDVEELGCAALIVGDSSLSHWPAAAAELGWQLWERRHAFRVPLHTPDAAVAHALARPRGPIVLVDSADGVSSGAPGDSTAILRALLNVSTLRPALVTVVDPAAVRTAVQQHGRAITLSIGGGLDPARQHPVEASGVARRVEAGRVTFSSGIGDGLSADMGTAAVLTVGAVQVLLMERPVPCYDPALYRAAGLEPGDAHIVVVKSPNNFRWAYRDIAREWLYVDAPGASTPRLDTLLFTHAQRPLFPIEDWDWRPAVPAAHPAQPRAEHIGRGR